MRVKRNQIPWLNLFAAVIDQAHLDIKKNNKYAEDAQAFLESSWYKSWEQLAVLLPRHEVAKETPRNQINLNITHNGKSRTDKTHCGYRNMANQ